MDLSHIDTLVYISILFSFSFLVFFSVGGGVVETLTQLLPIWAVFQTLVRSEGHLGQTPILPDGQAIIDFPPWIEKSLINVGRFIPNKEEIV